MKKVALLKNQKGISMVSLVITIIVILILSAIVFVSSGKTMGEADYSKYVSHVSDVSTAFEETTKLITGKMVVKNQYNQPEQIYNYVAKNGSGEDDVLKLKEVPKYTIIQDEGQFGIELPQMIVESGTGKRVPVKYATTKSGQIFTWPPYDHDDKFYITDSDTVEDKMQTIIKVGDEEFEIKLNYTDGTLLDWEGPINEDDDPIKPPEDDDFENPTEHEHSFTARVQTPQYFCSDATCLVPAKYYYKCTSCEVKGTETFTVGAALGHIYGEKTVVKEATCSEPGSAQSKCTRCGDILNLEVPKDSSNHNGRELQQITQEPTCATEGVKTYRCSACSTVLRTESIAKTDHNSEKIVITKEATCTSAGTKTYRCSVCNKEMRTEAITALGHSEDSFKITKTPTCKEPGTKVYTCSRCNQETRTEEVPIDTSKHYGSTETQTITPATCTGTGTTAKICSLCKATIGSGSLAALGHSWNASEPPRKCNRCGLEELGDATLAPNSTWYSQGGTTISRNQITSITFVDTYDTIGKTIVDQWDASIASTGTTDNVGPITSYIEYDELGNGTYKLTLAGNGTGKMYANNDSYGAFKDFTALNKIENISIFDTSNTTNMKYMFRNCSALTELDVSKFFTSNVTNIYGIFEDCTSITSLDVSNWNTSNMTDISHVFENCVKLQTVDVSKWDVSKAQMMGWMFEGCNSITEIDVSNWNTLSVTRIDFIFSGCSKLTQIDVSNWNTNNVVRMTEAFSICSSIKTLDLRKWNTSSVKYFDKMFYGCTQLEEILGIETWNTSSGLGFGGMFRNCSSIRVLDLSSFDTRKAMYGSEHSSGMSECTQLMFNKMYKLEKITLGENFTFEGDGTSESSYYGMLPTPSGDYITGADGKWYNADTGATYVSSEIPNNTGATYLAVPTYYTYNIVYESSTGKSLGTETVTKLQGTSNTISAPLKTGYITPASQSVTWDSVTPKTITFTYQIITYDILIDCDVGTGVSSTTYTIESDTFSLGIPTWSGGTFKGWVGSNGTTPQITVTIPKGSYGAKEYTATWEEKIEAFAIYSDTDNSLRFYKRAGVPAVGEMYNNLNVTAIFEGIETDIYELIKGSWSTYVSTPWQLYDGSIKSVIIEDEIKPVSTAYWFYRI